MDWDDGGYLNDWSLYIASPAAKEHRYSFEKNAFSTVICHR